MKTSFKQACENHIARNNARDTRNDTDAHALLAMRAQSRPMRHAIADDMQEGIDARYIDSFPIDWAVL